MPCIIPGSYGPSGFPGAPGFPGMECGQRKEALFKGLESKEAEDSLATSVLLRGFSATEETAAGDCGVGRRDSGRPAKRGGLLTKHHKYSLSLPFPLTICTCVSGSKGARGLPGIPGKPGTHGSKGGPGSPGLIHLPGLPGKERRHPSFGWDSFHSPRVTVS